MTQNWRKFGAKGIHFVQFLGKICVQNENQQIKTQKKHLASKKRQVPEIDQSLTISCKENVVLEAHKGFQKTKLNNMCFPVFWATGGGRHSAGRKNMEKTHHR